MEAPLKQRLIGAVVLAALALIFVPMLLKSPDVKDPDSADVPPLLVGPRALQPRASLPGRAGRGDCRARVHDPLDTSMTPSQRGTSTWMSN